MTEGEILRTLISGFPVMPEMLDSDYPRWIQAMGGLILTFCITGCSLLLGMSFGIVLVLLRDGFGYNTGKRGWNWLRRLSKGIVTVVVGVIRGLPIVIIVLLVYYLPFVLFKLRIPGVILAIVAFSTYAAAYQCDIVRSGFRAVDSGLINAARVLGLSRWQILRQVTLPIAFRTMLPAMLGLAVTIFKDTSVLVVVAVPELTYTARQMQMSDPLHYASILGTVLILYWIVSVIGSFWVQTMERAWDTELSL